MAENRRGRGLFYFSRGQLFVLGLGFTITSVVVFLLGVLIGQRIEERKLLKREEPLVKIPIQPQGLALAPGGPAKEEMTFYDTLAKAPAGGQTSRAEPAKQVKPEEKAVKPAEKDVKAIGQEKTTLAAKKVTEKASTEKSATVSESKKEAPSVKSSGAEAARAEPGTPERVWAVQVNAFPYERDAKNLVKKLKDKGYDAYVVSTEVQGKTWHRVRVGRLGTREEALTLQETLERKEKFSKSIITSRGG